MSYVKAIAELVDDLGELGCLLADVASVPREAHAASYPPPNWCLLGCPPAHWTLWGPSLSCTRCASRVLPADRWHTLLTRALRATVARRPWQDDHTEEAAA